MLIVSKRLTLELRGVHYKVQLHLQCNVPLLSDVLTLVIVVYNSRLTNSGYRFFILYCFYLYFNV